jgi:hypothetical protein
MTRSLRDVLNQQPHLHLQFLNNVIARMTTELSLNLHKEAKESVPTDATTATGILRSLETEKPTV